MKKHEIEQRIASAPEEFRARLQRLHERGFFTDPAVKARFLKIARQVAEENGLDLVQEPPQKATRSNGDFTNDHEPQK